MSVTLAEGQEKRLDIGLTPIPEEPATLWGVVSDAQTGARVNGAKIEVIGTGLSDLSDSAGNFRIEGIQPGTYSVKVSHPDYYDRTY